jgi:hypothetical protein
MDLRLRAVGLSDTRKNAARIAAAQHLLETCLRRHIIIEPTRALGAISDSA